MSDRDDEQEMLQEAAVGSELSDEMEPERILCITVVYYVKIILRKRSIESSIISIGET